MSNTERSYGWKILADLPKDTKLYSIVKHVSASGMTRWMSVYYVDEYGDICRVALPEDHNWLKTSAHGADYKVPGCGMDMCFHLVSGFGALVRGDSGYFRSEVL